MKEMSWPSPPEKAMAMFHPGFWRKVASLLSFLLGSYILVAGVYANIVGAAVGS